MLTKTGTVVGTKMQKTIKVDISSKVAHLLYKKYIKRSIILFAHDEEEKAKLGDKVIIRSSKPISKKKHWILDKIIS